MRFLVGLAAAAVVVAGCSSSQENVGRSNDAVDYICSEKATVTLDGIPAYAYCGDFNVWSNNGADTKSSSGGTGWVQTEGGYGYQCVEYAVRYEHFKFGVATGWGNAYAYQMCGNHPSSMSKVTTPMHGDLMVLAPGSCGANGTAGHVAVVDVVNSTTVKVVQENTAAEYTFNKSCASCWLHAANNTGSSDPCAAASDGSYCGQSSQFAGGTKGVLYDCKSGATATKTTCANGCTVEPPGTPDECAPPPADAGSDASESTDAASDAATTTDSGQAQEDAAPEADAGNVVDGSGGCSQSPSSRSSAASVALFAVVLAFIRRRRARGRSPLRYDASAAHRSRRAR